MNALLKSGMFLWLSLLSAQADVLFLNATSSPSDVGYYDTAGDSLITNEESYPIAMLVDEFTLSSAATVCRRNLWAAITARLRPSLILFSLISMRTITVSRGRC